MTDSFLISAKRLMPRIRPRHIVLPLFLLLRTLATAVDWDAEARGFADPPDAVKPSVWWFWGESVITEHGITADLEALKRVGFGGVVIYEQLFTDRPGAMESLSPEWRKCFRHAAAECARLGMTLEVNVGNGYVAGGPWITPDLGMQRLVSADVDVEGGRAVTVALPHPPVKAGYYRDVAVLAWPSRRADAMAQPAVSSQPPGVGASVLLDSARNGPAVIRAGADGACDIHMDYASAVTVRGIRYAMQPGSKALVIATQVPGDWSDGFLGQGMKPIAPVGELEASDDGTTWRVVCQLPGLGFQHDSWNRQSVSFPAVTARHFRLHLHDWNRFKAYKDDSLSFGPVGLTGDALIDHWESKSGNVVDFSNPDRTPDYAPGEVIDPSTIVDLTGRLDAEGTLRWNAPPGRWTVMRFGHTPTGAKTKHGRPASLGLECDKLSAKAAEVQFDDYAGELLREAARVPGTKISGLNIDSAEHGSQNWTADFAAQFRRRRGYDIHPYLPAMAGRVVGNALQSDKFLHDVRRTIADMMSECYFGTFQRRCRESGMTSMAQAPGIATCLPSDNIQAKGRTDIPMGEFWMSQPWGTIDCKETSSAAHVYGLPVAAAESFTGSGPNPYPAMMKPFADAALVQGINRFVVLAYVHQPWDDRMPGVTQDRFFLSYQRHNTWWEFGKGFWDTLSRSCLLLRTGRPCADLLYHPGDDPPVKIATNRMRPAPPAGYDYDVCGDEVLLSRLSVANGRFVLPDGTGYGVLVWSGGDRMPTASARRIRDLVKAGGCVLAARPWIGSPSLADADADVAAIAAELWGSGPVPAAGQREIGAGRFCWGLPPQAVLAGRGIAPDVAFPGHEAGNGLAWIHRKAGGDDVYFIANHDPRAKSVLADFRITGRTPELWNPQNGRREAVSGWHEEQGRTSVPLEFGPCDSLFVVFRTASHAMSPPASVGVSPVKIQGPWQVRFTPGWGAPESVTWDELKSWSESTDEGIRHYSGSAVYRADIRLPEVSSGQSLELDLGEVAVVASVKLNGVDIGSCWKAPWRVLLGKAARAGLNHLEITVANLWNNRMVADAGLPAEKRLTWMTWNPCKAGDPLMVSGLLGPVSLRILESGRPSR